MTLKITDWESTARTELSQCANRQMRLLNQMVEEALSSCQKDEDFMQLMQLFSKLAGGNAALADRASLNVDRLIRINNGRTLPSQSLRNPILQLCWAVVKNQSPLQPLLSYLGLEAKVIADELVEAASVATVATPAASEPEACQATFDRVQKFGFDPLEQVTGNRESDRWELSVRANNSLLNDGIIYLGDLMLQNEAVLLRTPNFGRKSLDEIKELLSCKGLRLGQFLPESSNEYIALEVFMREHRLRP